MKSYIGVKMIKAEEMTASAASLVLGRPIDTSNVDGCQDGYLVEYDSNYRSWSPKSIFEAAYLELEDATKITKNVVQEFFGREHQVNQLDSKTTHVRTETLTGFVCHEHSSCVDPKNYDAEIGAEICADRTRDKLWGHLGFVLQWAINGLNRA